VKLKTLAVITLVVLGCRFALAQAPGTFTFWTSGATLSYSDYLVITSNSGGIVAGYEDLSIFGDANAPVVGFVATTHKDGQQAWGKGSVIGDAIYDATCDCYSGLQWTLWVSDKVNPMTKGYPTGKYGWMGVAGSSSGFYFGENYGYLTAGIFPPKGEAAGHGTTAGKLRTKLRK
jgi:hypothetical protein